jgi:hypothetical protein
MTNHPEIRKFINEHSALFWYIPEQKKEEVSHELLVETILNYGSLEEIKQLFGILGIQEVSKIFFNAKGRKKLNYFPEIHNLFSIYFKRNA